jgi:hypothetical protein
MAVAKIVSWHGSWNFEGRNFRPVGQSFGGIMKMKILLAAISVLVISACGKNKNDSTKVAGVPGSFSAYANTCVNQVQPQAWYGYYQFGIRPYYRDNYRHRNSRHANSTQVVYNNGNREYCGCEPGYMPACDGQNGMACVPKNRFRNYRPATWGYNPYYRQVVAGQYGIPTYNPRSNCYSGFTHMCSLGQSDSCSLNGGICRPTSANSQFGVCVRR